MEPETTESAELAKTLRVTEEQASANNRRKRKQRQPIKLPNSSIDQQPVSPMTPPDPPPPPSQLQPPQLPPRPTSSLSIIQPPPPPPPPPPLASAPLPPLPTLKRANQSMVDFVSSADAMDGMEEDGGAQPDDDMALSMAGAAYESDPARRNKRGHRGIGKVQPRQLDNGLEAFPCPACDKDGIELFLHSREELTAHLRTHNKPNDVSGGHICAICGRELSSQSSLDRHMLTHSDERPFMCPLCPTAFTTNGNMRRHLSTHKSDPDLRDEVTRHLNTDKRRKRHRAIEAAAAAAAAAASTIASPAAPGGQIVINSNPVATNNKKANQQAAAKASSASAIAAAAAEVAPMIETAPTTAHKMYGGSGSSSSSSNWFGTGAPVFQSLALPLPQPQAQTLLPPVLQHHQHHQHHQQHQQPLQIPMSISLSSKPLSLTKAVESLRPLTANNNNNNTSNNNNNSQLAKKSDKSFNLIESKSTSQAVVRAPANRKRGGASGGGGGTGASAGGNAIGVTLHPGAYFNRLPSLRAARRLRRRYLQLLHHHSQGQSVSLPSSSRKRVSLSGMSQAREGKRGRRESSVLHRCDQCNRKCFGKKNLVIHRATCHGTPPQKTIYCCLGRMQDGAPCGEKDEDLATMKRHVMINHIKIDPYICKLCNPGAVFTVGLDDKHLHKQHGSFCTRENAHRHLLQQSSHEYIADMRRRLNPNSDDTSQMRDQKLDQWRAFAAHVKKEFCGVVRVSDDLKQRLIGDENSSCNVCQLDLGSPEALRAHFEARPSCEVRFACPHCSHDLLGPEQFLEHLKVKHLDCSATEPRACVTKKVVWLKRPRQRPTKTAEEQPLDLSVAAVAAAASVTAKEESTLSAINDSGCPQTPAKDAAVLNPFLSAWTSPLWPGLFTWPFSYPPQLLAPSALPAIDSQAAAAVAAAAAAASAAATSTPAMPDPGDLNASSVSSGASKPQRRSEESAEAAATPGRASSVGGNSNSDSESDAGPLKKKAKKNSYKDAPNLIFCPFSNCKQSFPWMSSLKRHIITHTSHKPYCCTRCSQSFSTKSNRERHMERIHHIKVKGKVRDNPHAALSSEELSTFFEHDKVAEKIGEELLNQLGNNVVTSVNPQRLLQRADCDQDSALSSSPSGSGGNQSLSASGASAAATAAAIVSAEVASLRSVYKCPECQFATGNRRDALEHLRSRHSQVWQLVAARSRLATVDAVMADGAAAPCSDEDEADDDVNVGKVEEVRAEEDYEDNDEAVASFGAVHTEEEDDDADEEDEDAATAEGSRLLCLVCSARLWSRRQLRGHMRGHTGCKPHRCSLCSRAFRLRQTLCRHLFARHPAEMLEFRRQQQQQSADQQGLLFQPWQPFQLDQQKSISRRESPINLRIDTGSSSS